MFLEFIVMALSIYVRCLSLNISCIFRLSLAQDVNKTYLPPEVNIIEKKTVDKCIDETQKHYLI